MAAPNRQIPKTVAVSLLRAAVLYLAYKNLLVPKYGVLPRELQKGLWWSVKNAWKMGRYQVRAHLPSGKTRSDSPPAG